MVESVSAALSLKSYHAPVLEVAGVSFPADAEVISPAIRAAILAGRFETEEARHVPRIVEPGDRVIEIGAGTGLISTLASRTGRAASVLAVEANPGLMEYMARLHALNGVRDVRRLNAVLTGAPYGGSATFYVRDDFWMGSLMPGPNPYRRTVEVPTRNFSALLRREAATLIICDIEGAETMLFDGADLAGVDRVFLELHDHITGLAGVGRVFATLAARGFAYDPRHSEGSVVLFRKLRSPELIRPYAG